jgi:hypothetical protein
VDTNALPKPLLDLKDLGYQFTYEIDEGPPEVFVGRFEENINLSELAVLLLPAEIQLPAELPRITLAKLEFEFTQDTGEFSFSGGAELGLGQKFSFFGINFSLPDEVGFNVTLAKENGPEGAPPRTTLSIGVSVDASQALTVSSNLAWIRDLGPALFREVQNDEKDQPEDIIRVTLKPNQDVSITLVEIAWGESRSTSYFKDFDAEVWQIDLTLNIKDDAFELPFLKQKGEGTGGSAFPILDQSITIASQSEDETEVIEGVTRIKIPISVDNEGVLRLSLPVTVRFGSLLFTARVPFTFDMAKVALGIDHEQGVHLLSNQASFITPELLGLSWTFAGAKVEEPDQYHYFTLVTKDLNYQLQLAPGAYIDLAYSEISQEPIVFRVDEFVISSKGLTLTAGITDTPVRLNGLDTKFRFAGSQLRIVENKIQDLTIAGSGPLPPDLVGNAVADIALQFKQVEGGLRLVSGGAQLRGDKPLACKGTRFQFSIDAIGLKFVYDQKFHLYFVLTGQAKFVPEPSDDKDGPLAFLPEISLDLVECPLTGDASVIAKHINFLVEFPTPLSFSFLGAYGFELRAIGFLPQCEKFNGRGAMILSGQVMFAQGSGDIADPKADLHKLYIGLPPKGQNKPQVDMGTLPVGIKAGEKFKLSGSVGFKFDDTMQGFTGDGVLEITGMPPMAASFGFMRVRRDANAPWVRAWFIYLEVRQVSLQIPVLQFYIREVGLGFGYRFTLVAIKAADEAGDIKQLIQELTVLSRTQGDLAKQDRWSVDLEEAGQDPRWTIVLRAMISQLSAAPSPLTWNEEKERALSNTYLFDAIIAVRSDLTFFMSVRGWLNSNYGTFVKARNDNKALAPLFSGFVLLSVRQKRFLAHLASDPNGHLGTTEYPLKPPLPPFAVRALRNTQVSATLLIEPGLTHFELGWPNMLRWSDKLGPLTAELRGGFIFRISTTELLIGVSFLARARLEIRASINLGLVGASLTAIAEAAYGARFIGLVPFDGRSLAVYGAIGLELRIDIRLSLWIKIPLIFTTIKLSFSFSFQIGFTAGLEVGVLGDQPGLRGRGTIALSVMGHSLQFSVKLGVNESAVTAARQATEKYLTIGLEATDVETSLPGVDPGARALRAVAFGLTKEESQPNFNAPDYSAFVVRKVEADDYCYFVLLPRGEREDGTPERGFLPVPPAQNINWKEEGYYDFHLVLPGEVENLERFDPNLNAWSVIQDGVVTWKANWEAAIKQVDEVYNHADMNYDNEESAEPSETKIDPLTLRQYLRQAFLVQESDGSDDNSPDDVVPTGDPPALYTAMERLEDERVRNPSDSAFEAAVRGAVEQFRGSPFFKHDPNLAYDRALEDAFQPDTTIYSDDGLVPADDEAERQVMEGTQQAHQIRGLVIHDLVNDLREYVRPSSDKESLVPGSIPFQMGLVFRVPSDNVPGWLQEDVETLPKIYQRTAPGAKTPPKKLNEEELDEAYAHEVKTFNLSGSDFAANPPQFQQVQHFTDANTIAIAWDLAWEQVSDPKDARTQPEHHLQYYMVRRRPLDGRTPEVIYRVKNASVLHREGEDPLKSLKPRFQVVDHFNQETLEQQAGLPTTGRSYLYTITPVDFTDKLGQPLTLVATRYPNEPPRVPVDGELAIEYHLSLEAPGEQTGKPQAVIPAELRMTWSEASNPKEGPTVAIDDYYLIFRRETTLPIGSYGLDSSTQRARTGLLPTSNARALPTDIKVLLVPSGPRGRREATHARLPSDDPDAEDRPLLEVLRRARVFPEDAEATWKAEAWRVFIQTVSSNQVPSALAPVQLLLRARSQDSGVTGVEERRPAELEWLPQPIRLPILPPEDQRAVTGVAHVPMPEGTFKFSGGMDGVSFQAHPLGLRCIRFRWNQGPSNEPDYPLNLTAGYELLELDVDAHTKDTFDDQAKLAKALRRIQEVQMLPAADLWLAPGDTLSTNQWEAWYPSAAIRRQAPELPLEGSEIEEGPWYSWRESRLEWPEWPGLTDLPSGQGRDPRPGAIHPLLQAVIIALEETYTIDLQTSPPLQPQDFGGFLQSTDPESDPYGWGALQRFGLAIAFSLRSKADGALITGQELLQEVDKVLTGLDSKHGAYLRYLHVELLFQPGRRVELSQAQASPEALLGILQLSMRPAIRQVLRYRRVEVQGPAGGKAQLNFTFSKPFSLIDQSDPSSGQAELVPDGADTSTSMRRTISLPPTGHTNLLVRGEELPDVQRVDPEEEPDNKNVSIGSFDFAPTAPLSVYFTQPMESLAATFASDEAGWIRFKRYAEALTPQGSGEPHIEVKTDEAGLKEQLPDFLAWAQRFFDASAPVEVGPNGPAQTGPGPWLTTAYPRVTTPALVVPDESGRLTYDHLLQDKWAHNYRYYLRPYDRYRLLWKSLLTSALLFPEGAPEIEELKEALPDPEAGGLDVVLDRTQPVDMPLVLSSARLDPPSKPGQPAAPGSTWEVIVAQHSEQSLIERNQTLARQLSFRQTAFTLLRRFAYEDWVDQLEKTVVSQSEVDEHRIDLLMVRNVLPDSPPEGYPEQPDHIRFDPSQPGYDDLIRSLDLPERIGNFQQGALVLQWTGLPFYYEHRLLLVAQTSSTVSPVNEVTQRDFEYCSPDLSDKNKKREPTWTATVDGQMEKGIDSGEPFVKPGSSASIDLRSRKVRIPLHRFWDCLPETAQAQWAAEKPSMEDGMQRKPASLPDPEVVYQILEISSGDIEVQVEVYFDQNGKKYSVRQLGRRFIAATLGLTPPEAPQADYVIDTTLREIGEVTLQRNYDESAIPAPTRHKIAFDPENRKLTVLGVMSKQDFLSLVLNPVEELKVLIAEFDLLEGYPGTDLAKQGAFLDEWYASRLVTEDAPELPDEIADKVDYRPIYANQLIALTGPLTTSDPKKSVLSDLASRCDSNLKAALQRLASMTLVSDQRIVVAVPGLKEAEIPGAIKSKVALASERSQVTWTGPMTIAQKAALATLIGSEAADRLADLLIAAVFETAYALPAIPQLPVPVPSIGTFSVETEPGPDWIMSWTGPITAEEEVLLPGIVDDENYRVGIKTLIRKVLAGQKWEANRLRQTANQAQAAADQAKANDDPKAGELQAKAEAAEQKANEAESVLNDALATYDQLTSPGEGEAITPTALANPLADTRFTVVVPWRITAAHMQRFLGPQIAGRLSLPSSQGEPLRWQNAYDLDVSNLVNSVGTGLNREYPAIQPFPVVQSFVQSSADLMAKIQNATFTIDYRPMQSQCPAELREQLILRGKLLHAKGPLNEEERATLLEVFPDEPDRDSVMRLIEDLLDKEILENLYNGWFVQELVSQQVSLDLLPEDFRYLEEQELVDYVETKDSGTYIRYHGVMLPEEGLALKALFSSTADQEAIQRLYDKSVSTSLYVSQLKITARRGGAAPSEMRALEGISLE